MVERSRFAAGMEKVGWLRTSFSVGLRISIWDRFDNLADGERAISQHARPSTRTLTQTNGMHIKKPPPYAILKSFADDLKLPPIGLRTQQAYYAGMAAWADIAQRMNE